ncbi:MAG: nucleoside transporter [Acidobacteria bacterium]|nr:MAG: nucleoside transporter [Acidobacteriota bacterium]
MALHFVSAAGFVGFAAIAWLFSENRRKVPVSTVAWGLGLQLVIGSIVFRFSASQRFFLKLNDAVLALLDVTRSGTAFLFGPLAAAPGEPGSIGFVLIFQVLPVAIFFSAFTAALYHLRILQLVVRVFARLFHRTLGTSGAEALCGAANIFVGVESALVVRPYLDAMTRSELLTVLTTGMATVASSTLGIYVAFLNRSFPQIAGHLLSASVLSIPAAIVMTKILVPETGVPATLRAVPPDDPGARSRNLMSAIIAGAMDGLKLAAGICALLIAVLGLVALVDKLLALTATGFGLPWRLELATLLGWLFYPLAALLGLAPADIPAAARLLGERVILTEVVSYQHLAELTANGGLADPRTVVILSYALCGFAHVASVAIFVGGTAALAPARRDDLASLGMRALVAATLATLMTGCVAGIFSTGQGVLLSRP